MKNNNTNVYIYPSKELITDLERNSFLNTRFYFIIDKEDFRAFKVYALNQIEAYTEGFGFYVYDPSVASLEYFKSYADMYDYVMSLT